MGKQAEGSLQERIQKLVRKMGGCCNKNWGSMVSEPGIADLTVGYKGLYLAIEVKVDTNTPSKQQGIHCRNVWRSGNIAFITWNVGTVEDVLLYIGHCIKQCYSIEQTVSKTKLFMQKFKIDTGEGW